MPAPLLIVDGDNLAHRAYHSTPKSVVGVTGEPINAIVGWVSMLQRVWTEERPRGVFVAWDTLGVDTYRNKLWPPYQTGREFEPSIVHQLGLLPKVCEAFGFGVGKAAGYEADDLLASAALAEVRGGGTALLFTADKDAYQLVREGITVISPKRGTPVLDRIDPVEVVRRFGVLPEQVAAFKALSGDASDKIPGIKGVGPKSAASLLLKYGSLDGVLAHWPNPDEVERARIFHEVVQMQTEAPVTLPTAGPDWHAGAAALRALGAEKMAQRVEGLASLA